MRRPLSGVTELEAAGSVPDLGKDVADAGAAQGGVALGGHEPHLAAAQLHMVQGLQSAGSCMQSGQSSRQGQSSLGLLTASFAAQALAISGSTPQLL